MAASSSPPPSSPTLARQKSFDPTPESAPAPRPPATRLERKAGSALRRLFQGHPGLASTQRHLVAVSGGRDSVALLHFLHAWGFKDLVVCHVNHQLRGLEADGDALFVQQLTLELGFTYEGAAVDVPALARKSKQSIETAARQARRGFFEEAAQRQGCQFIFLAHHADDDVETILHHLLRGSSLRGIRGMEPVALTEGGLGVVRPFLSVPRADIDAYISRYGLTYREDVTNEDAGTSAPTRNRIRHRLVPFLQEVLQREVTAPLQRFARLASQDEDCLQAFSTALVEEHQLLLPDRSLQAGTALKTAHPALQGRILRWWLRDVQGVPQVGAMEVEQALELLGASRPARINLPGNRRLRRKSGRLFVELISVGGD